MDFFKSVEDNEESSLLQTIRVPKNLLFLTDKLPQPNYEKIPNKRNLSFTNNKSELPDINGKNRIKKNKKQERNGKDRKELSENKDYKERYNNEGNEDQIVLKRNEKIDEDQDEATNIKRKKIAASLDHSQLSANNRDHGSGSNNIRIIKDADLDSKVSIIREKSPVNDDKKRSKDANGNVMLPNIKGNPGPEYIKYEDSRSARMK